MKTLLIALISGLVVSILLAVIAIYLVTYTLLKPPTNYTSNMIVVSDLSKNLVKMKSDLNISYYYPLSNRSSVYTINSFQPVVMNNPIIVTNNTEAYEVIGIEKNSTIYILEHEGYYKLNIIKLNESEKYIYYNVTIYFEFKPKGTTIIFIPIWDSKYSFSSYIIVIFQPGTIISSQS